MIATRELVVRVPGSVVLAVAVTVAVSAAPGAAGAQSFTPQTAWANDHGSTLTIREIGADGRLSGTYSFNIPGYACRNIDFPLTGWVDGDRIAYTMRAKTASADCGFVVSWTAVIREGRLEAEWVRADADPRSGRSILVHGTDLYRPK